MTVVNPKSISGITSITTPSGSDDLLTIHTNNGTERLRVDSTGATKIVTGIVTTLTATTGIVTTLTANTTTHLSDVTFTGSSANIIFDQSDDALEFNDDAKATFGTGADTTFTHSGADFAITNTTGNLNILNNSADAVQIRHGNETMIKAISDGAVELYHDNNKKIVTTNQGAAIGQVSTIPTMDSFSCQINAGNSGFIGNFHSGSNQQFILGLNQYYQGGYRAPDNNVSQQLQLYNKQFNFLTAPAPGSDNAVVTNTKILMIDDDGIKFGNDTAAANALDDYEEGTWTPTVNGTNSNLTHRVSRYTKIGNLVSLQVEFYTSGGNFSTGANMNLGNLPFAGPATPMHVVGSASYMNSAYGMTLMTNYLNSSSQWYFSQATGSGLYLWGNITYQTA